ncbi:ATP-binding cassette domain-containing protein [Nocardioidaceae bacterium SCSIO 66511]|nr:ATP-binding cassette domain-containing protein [Nocardioidaceae bacterium SCSIO 66511]
MTTDAVFAHDLRKRFGPTEALRGIDLVVAPGTVCGLLGPNGAGKTTFVSILATLTRPDAGSAVVAGVDVVQDPGTVRRLIGLAGQHAAVDEKLTGRENLRMFGRLYHLGERAASTRADELLEQFGLADAGTRLVRAYSGGMRRRLDLAASLILSPTVLFLDEPTTGLDPRSRSDVWESVRTLVAAGTSVLLTTQYLDEADQLADEIAVIDTGRVIASGTPAELKRHIGGDRVEVTLSDAAALPKAESALAAATGATPEVTESALRVSSPTSDGAAALAATVRALDAEQIVADDIALRRPTLDDVFLQLTGHTSDAATTEEIGAA